MGQGPNSQANQTSTFNPDVKDSGVPPSSRQAATTITASTAIRQLAANDEHNRATGTERDSAGMNSNLQKWATILLGTRDCRPADRSLVHTSETIDRNSTIGMAQKRTSTCVNTDPRRAISPARYDGFIGRLLLVVGPNLLFADLERARLPLWP